MLSQVVKCYEDILDVAFAALSDATRRGIVEQLAGGEATVGELAEPYGISLPAVSKHLRVLEQAGLIERRRAGREVHCRFNGESLRSADEWLSRYRRFLDDRFDALAEVLSQPPHEKGSKKNKEKKK